MKMPPRLDRIDNGITWWMERYGHWLHRISLGLFFTWMGSLKISGVLTATSLLAQVIYWGTPETMVPLLGAWELAIGLCLLYRPLARVALLMLAVRLPGTLMALVLLPDICFSNAPLLPTVVGQYLIKDSLLFSAAIVIGGTVRREWHPHIRH